MDVLLNFSRHKLRNELLRCCHCDAWADAVLSRFPFSTDEEARAALDECWGKLTPADYLQAIAAHPAVGDKQALRDNFAPSRSGWEAVEQAASAEASETVLTELSELNRLYVEKNGFVFLVCASGKPASEILSLLKARLPNDRDTELKNAVEEQRKITQLRFSRLLADIAAAAATTTTTAGRGGGGTDSKMCVRSRI